MSKLKNMLIGVMAALVLALGTTAQAVPITGDIDIGGRLVGTTALNAITALNFAVSPPSRVTVADGDFAANGVVAGTTLATMSNFSFSPFVAPQLVWTVPQGFSFTLQSLSIDTQVTNALGLSGFGIMNGPAGFDPTPYAWSFSANRTATGSTIRISFSENNAPVPEPASMLLLGSGLLGLGIWGRKMRQSA